MIRCETAGTAASRRFRVDGHGAGAWIHPYFGTGDAASTAGPGPLTAGADHPMLYRVAQDPSTSIVPHFHQVDQFQIVVRGSGRLGRAPVEPVFVHFASAHTGYGPLDAGPTGLDYLTVRNRWDPGLRPLPESRHELAAVANRRPIHHNVPVPDDSAIAPGGDSTRRRLIGSVDDRTDTAAWSVRAAGGAPVPLPGSPDTDRVVVVLTGTLSVDAAPLGPLDCAFLHRNADNAPLLTAGERGASFLLLQFRSPT